MDNKKKDKLTICVCASRSFIPREQVARLAVAASKAGKEVQLVSDLCELCEDKDPAVHRIATGTIAACYPRAVKSLMAFVGEEGGTYIDLRSDQPTEEATAEEMAPWLEQMAAMPCKHGEDAWYPTIDKDVCCECGKCHEFCPFGVYEEVEDRIRVVHPHHCKNNCPACARTCPAGAIIFPKYDHSPINGGEEKQEAAVQLDTSALYNQAFRDKLAKRRTSIFNKKP